jgi:hypothetical protein
MMVELRVRRKMVEGGCGGGTGARNRVFTEGGMMAIMQYQDSLRRGVKRHTAQASTSGRRHLSIEPRHVAGLWRLNPRFLRIHLHICCDVQARHGL